MRASEFIKELQKAVDKYGDLHVVIESASSGDFVIPCNIKPFARTINEEGYEEECKVFEMDEDDEFKVVRTDTFKDKEYFYLA